MTTEVYAVVEVPWYFERDAKILREELWSTYSQALKAAERLAHEKVRTWDEGHHAKSWHTGVWAACDLHEHQGILYRVKKLTVNGASALEQLAEVAE